MKDQVVQQIKNELATMDETERLIAKAIAEEEAAGFLVVNSDACGGVDCNVWVYGTGESLGKYKYADPWPPHWAHLDPVTEDLYGSVKTISVAGLPDSLISVLNEWTAEHEEEARKLVDGFR